LSKSTLNPLIICAACKHWLNVERQLWGDIWINARVVASKELAITPVAIAIAPSVRDWLKSGGKEPGNQICLIAITFIWFLPWIISSIPSVSLIRS